MFGKSTRVTQDMVLGALKTVQEPELHRDLVTLNMVKDIEINDGDVRFTITLTTPACPIAQPDRERGTGCRRKGARCQTGGGQL